MPRKKHPLDKCLAVVEKLMKQPQAMQLFNAPVDIDGLGLTDYLEVVKTPMDLATIKHKLLEGQAAEWHSCQYQTPEQVLEDINLVWSNCISYNTRPDEEPIARAAREMAKKSDELWAQCGLKGSDAGYGPQKEIHSVVSEADISPLYSGPGSSALPIRTIDQLLVYGEDKGSVRMWSIDCHLNTLGVPPGISASPPASIYARGTLKPPDSPSSSGLSDIEVDIGPILDWSISLSGASACVCVQTATAWYHVRSPAPEYEPLFFLCQLFAHLAHAAIIAISEAPSLELNSFIVLTSRWLLQRYPKESLLFHVKLCLPLLSQFLAAWATAQSPLLLAAQQAAVSSQHPPQTASAQRIAVSINQALQDQSLLSACLHRAASVISHINQYGLKLQMDIGTAGSSGLEGAPLSPAASILTSAPPPVVLDSISIDVASRNSQPMTSSEAEKRKAHLESKRAYEAERRRRKAAEEDALRAANEAAAAQARGPPPPPQGTWRTPVHLLPNLLSIWDFLGTFADVLWLPPVPLARLDAALSPNSKQPEPVDEGTDYVLRDIHCALLRVLEGRAGKGAEMPRLPVLKASQKNLIPCVGDHHWQGWAGIGLLLLNDLLPFGMHYGGHIYESILAAPKP